MNKVASLGVDNSINGQTTQLDSLLRKYTKISWENGLMIMTYLNPTQILSETDSSKLPVAPPNPAHTLPRYQRAEAASKCKCIIISSHTLEATGGEHGNLAVIISGSGGSIPIVACGGGHVGPCANNTIKDTWRSKGGSTKRERDLSRTQTSHGCPSCD